MSTPAAPAGWYLDPSDTSRERWWDGTQWGPQSRPLSLVAPAPHPPGWYRDAHGANRYWDGREWTEHVAPPPPRLVSRPPALWWAIAAAALMVVGGLGPWATALRVVDVAGTHGDGWLVIGAGLVAAIVLFVSPGDAGPVVALLAAIGGAIVAIVDLSDIQSRGALIEPAWGLYAVLLSAVALFAASLVLLLRRPSQG
jgi:Protein of unknown function (DUF2510)